jgi:hypothetical protein
LYGAGALAREAFHIVWAMLGIFKKRKGRAQELADQAERILSGECRKWDVDAYERASPRDPKLKDVHLETLGFGLPETWVKLEEAQKVKLREIIERMRHLDPKVS